MSKELVEKDGETKGLSLKVRESSLSPSGNENAQICGAPDGRLFDQQPNTFLCERDLAQRWACSIKKLQSDRLHGAGPTYVKIGRLVRYPLNSVLAYEQARLHTAPKASGA